jgi:signal peptidase II
VTPKALAFWPALFVVVIADFATKRLVEQHLIGRGTVNVIGDFLRFRLAYNAEGAMGMSLGGASRVGFSFLAVIMLALLVYYYRHTAPADRLRAAALGLISGGALGNLIDRWRSHMGVVDFIDVGIGQWRFYTFNLADSALTCGGIALALMLFVDERAARGKGEPGAT